ncbi:hypothetical protein F4777DRAFT_395763 [Nemania sp. FL0916]|nr:hypothetical protein F4777DRAFT_395763 [Nemania sp. FL0916]
MGRQEDNNYGVVHETMTRGSRTGFRRTTPVQFGRENASACVTACFDELVPHVKDACHQLQQPEYQRSRLWDLYCCDSTNCGVYIGNLGQSPNVDLIINKCQNLGFFSIEDPGPPATNYCTASTLNIIATGSPHNTATVGPSIPPAPRTRPASTESLPPLPPTYMSGNFPPFAPTSVSSSSLPSTSSPAPSTARSANLTRGAKAAIGVSSIIALLAIVAILFFMFRWRRRHPRCCSPGPPLLSEDNRPYSGPQGGSATPLPTPPRTASSQTAPLTPPAKLSDRRYLEPVIHQGTPRPSNLSGMGDSDLPPPPPMYPSSPVHRPVHRHVRSTAASNFKTPISSHCRHNSSYGPGNELGDFTVKSDANKASSVYSNSATMVGNSTPPLPATKFPPGQDRHFEPLDFAMPVGPPPSRALPRPPSKHPNSPTFSGFLVSPRSPTFPARDLGHRDKLGVSLHQANTSKPLPPITAREQLDLSGSHVRESWGSWSGVGGGGPGVVPVGRQRGSAEKRGDKTAVPMQELDLEKLAGGY